ncbi:MAG: orotate phosphoribosyltransferase [Thermomicrobiales bacterium]
MSEPTAGEVLRAAGAIKQGHFLFSSGLHGDTYVEKFDLLRNPRATEQICRGFVRAFADAGVDVVAGPTTGGILLAFETARQLGVAAAYAEREGETGRAFRRGTTFVPGTRVLVVDDILTTGGSVRETLAALAVHDVTVVGIGVLWDRSGGKVDFGVPLVALNAEEIAAYPPDQCPLCAAGIPLVKPGTTAKPGPR